MSNGDSELNKSIINNFPVMEVHHHAHTSRKKWTHYFWEFLMLFLAVFCGFLAEYQLEHLIEHQREKKYMQSLKVDLEKDILQIDQNQLQYLATISTIDSILAHADELFNDRVSYQTIRQIHNAVGFPDFVYTDRTIQQLKNAGNMRLIRKTAVADSIIGYDAYVRRTLTHQDILNSIVLNGLMAKMKYVLNYELIVKSASEEPAIGNANPVLNGILISNDKTEIRRLLNEYVFYRQALNIHIANVLRIKRRAGGVLEVLVAQYHLSEKTE